MCLNNKLPISGYNLCNCVLYGLCDFFWDGIYSPSDGLMRKNNNRKTTKWMV